MGSKLCIVSIKALKLLILKIYKLKKIYQFFLKGNYISIIEK